MSNFMTLDSRIMTEFLNSVAYDICNELRSYFEEKQVNYEKWEEEYNTIYNKLREEVFEIKRKEINFSGEKVEKIIEIYKCMYNDKVPDPLKEKVLEILKATV